MNRPPDKDVDLQQLLTVEQVSTTLQMSTKQVRRLIDRREIPAHRFGRLIRVSPGALQTYINSHAITKN